MEDDTGTTPPAAAGTPATPQPGGHCRGEPDDGRRFTYDPAGATQGPAASLMPVPPWRVDGRGLPPWWVSRDMLPGGLIPVDREEWRAWLRS